MNFLIPITTTDRLMRPLNNSHKTQVYPLLGRERRGKEGKGGERRGKEGKGGERRGREGKEGERRGKGEGRGKGEVKTDV
jgi:hypothetical protein